MQIQTAQNTAVIGIRMLAIRIIILVFIFSYGVLAEEYVYAELIKCENVPFSEKERGSLDDSFYKEIRKYKREGLVTHCEDSLSNGYIEVDPRPCGGMLDGLYSVCFNNSIDDELARKCEEIYISTINEIKVTRKKIHCKNFEEKIIEIHDKKDSLLFYKHYKWDGKMLVQTVDDSVVRKIIPGKTPCYFTVIEPSGDSISFILNPKKRISGSIRTIDSFFNFFNGYNILFEKNNKRHGNREYGEHDAIVYHWHSFCKTDPEFEILTEIHDSNTSQEEEPYASVKDDGSSPHKYHAIIALCIAVAGFAVAYKRRKRRKEI